MAVLALGWEALHIYGRILHSPIINFQGSILLKPSVNILVHKYWYIFIDRCLKLHLDHYKPLTVTNNLGVSLAVMELHVWIRNWTLT